jgi:hypothetical protein
MFSLTRNLSLTMAAAAVLAILTASVPASSDERVVNLGTCRPGCTAQQQRAQTYEAFKGVKNDHDRFATKVDPPQEPEQTKLITR